MYEGYHIYFLLKDNVVVYVGQTGNIQYRLYAHKDKDYNSVRMIECDVRRLNYYEKRWIERFKPKYNKFSNTPVYRLVYKLGEWGNTITGDEALWRLIYDKKFTKQIARSLNIIYSKI